MKKFLSFILMLSLVFMFSGCGDNENNPAQTQAPQKNEGFTTDDVISMFKEAEKDESITVKDCVLTPDGAYDLIGVVLYSNSEKPCKLAFVDKDGVSQHVGFDSNIADDSILTYSGNGTVNFKMINTDGLSEDYSVSFSRDADGVHFTANADTEI